MNLQELDDELLAELIEKCEAAMGKPFKKEKPQPKVEIAIESSPEKDPEVSRDHNDDEELDLEELMRAYESRK